ncbi:MAG: hypothetical protein R2867_19320 [Caldilineaceae bacterium]
MVVIDIPANRSLSGTDGTIYGMGVCSLEEFAGRLLTTLEKIYNNSLL